MTLFQQQHQQLVAATGNNLSDKSTDKRKQAAQDISDAVKSVLRGTPQTIIIGSANEAPEEQVARLIQCLVEDFCKSAFPSKRKGGLMGLASAAIALERRHVKVHVPKLVPPVLTCFSDENGEVRYSACEAFYNIAKVARQSILPFFDVVFDGLCRLFADVEQTVKDGGQCLDRLIKDIVTESRDFDHAAFVVPLLTTRIRVLNPFVRQLVLGWIVLLDSVPSVDMIAHVSQFLDGLFGILASDNRDIRQSAVNCLNELLLEIRASPRVRAQRAIADAAPTVARCCRAGERRPEDNFVRLTALNWLLEFVKLQVESETQGFDNFPADLVGPVGPRCVSGGLQLAPQGHFRLQRDTIFKRSVQLDVDISHRFPTGGGAAREKRNHARIRSMDDVQPGVQPVTTFRHARNRSSGYPNLNTPKRTEKKAEPESPGRHQGTHAESPSSEDRRESCECCLEKLAPVLLEGALHCLDDGESEIRDQADKANKVLWDAVAQRLEANKTPLDVHVQRFSGDLPVEAIMEAVLGAMTGASSSDDRSESVLIACFKWARLLLERCPVRVLRPPLCERLFKACLATVSRPENEVATTALKLVAQLVREPLDGATSPSEPSDYQAAEDIQVFGGDFFTTMCERLFKRMAAEDNALLLSRGELVVRELCSGVGAGRFYETAAQAVSRLPPESGFARPFVRVLNQVLLTSRETKNLRARLFHAAVKSPVPEAEDPKLPDLLLSLLRSWFHCPVSTLALCLWLHWFELAAEVTARLARFDFTQELKEQLDEFIALLESPVFMRVRLQMLETQRHPALLRTLLGLVALLPREQTLRARLKVVETELLLERLAPCQKPMPQAPQSSAVECLLSEFDKVTNEHGFRRCIL